MKREIKQKVIYNDEVMTPFERRVRVGVLDDLMQQTDIFASRLLNGYEITTDDKKFNKRLILDAQKKYGDDFALNVFVNVYKDLTDIKKRNGNSIPIGAFASAEQGGEIKLGGDVQAVDIAVKLCYYKDGKLRVVGRRGQDRLFEVKIVFSASKAKKGTALSHNEIFKDAMLLSRQYLVDNSDIVKIEGFEKSLQEDCTV